MSGEVGFCCDDAHSVQAFFDVAVIHLIGVVIICM